VEFLSHLAAPGGEAPPAGPVDLDAVISEVVA
jgi:hypothetical protein